jgi:RND family efflux transporter MFP subunit
MKKIIFVAIAVLILGGVGFQLYRKLGKNPGSNRQRNSAPIAVETAPVERIVLKDVGEFSGSLAPVAQFVVAPKLGGRLDRLTVDIGDVLRRGELIAVLEGEETAQQAEQAKAELEVAKASLEDSKNTLLLAERERERARVLREKQIASVAEFDQADAQLKAAESKHMVSQAQVRQKEAALKGAEVRLSYTRIKASWNHGTETRVVGERYAEEGALLNAGDPIVSVLDIDTLIAVIKVIERDYTRVREGQRAVVISDLFPGRTFEAKVARIAPLLKEEARQAEARVEVPNASRLLKPGMFVRVQIEFARKEDAQAVPLSALVSRHGEQGVFLVDGDGTRARFVPVKPGITYEGYVEILDPQLSGTVVTLGNHLLEDGAPIRVSGAQAESPGDEPMSGSAPRKGDAS